MQVRRLTSLIVEPGKGIPVIEIFFGFEYLRRIAILPALLVAILTSPAFSADFDSVIDDALSRQSIPGVSAVVILDHQVIYAAGRGVADIQTGRLMSEQTVMYIGSLSKVLTAVLVLNQVESGALVMTDTLVLQPPITLLQLISHQSGLRFRISLIAQIARPPVSLGQRNKRHR